MQQIVSVRFVNLLGLFGVSVTSIVNDVLQALTLWVASGARVVMESFGHTLMASTSVTFSSTFMLEFNVVRNFGAVLVAAFLCAVTIQAVLQQNASLLIRSVGIRLPVALLLSGIGAEIVTLLVHGTDALSNELLQTSARSVSAMISGIRTMLASSPVLAGFEGLILAFVLAVVVFICWLELVIRAAAISIATLFIPLALAGVVWPLTQQWIRRLGETLFALIMSKVVIAAVFALAISSMGSPQGLNMVVEGIALFVLCAWAPLSVLRLVPFIESGAVSHLESLGQRSGQALRHLGSSVAPIVGDYFSPAPSPGVDEVDAIPWAPGDPNIQIEVDAEDADFFKFLGPYVKVRESSSPSDGTDAEFPGSPPKIIRVNRAAGKD